MQDEIDYTIENLDLSGFSVEKEKVKVYLGESPVDSLLKIVVTDFGAVLKQMHWSYTQLYFPFLSGGGIAEASIKETNFVLHFSLERIPLIQNGSFEKRQNVSASASDWVPRLGLSDIVVTIGDLSLQIGESRLSFLYNLLVKLFQVTVKDYLVSSLSMTLDDQIEGLMDSVNSFAEEHLGWSTILSLAGKVSQKTAAGRFGIMDLPEARPDKNKRLVLLQDAPTLKAGRRPDEIGSEVEITFENASLGMRFNYQYGMGTQIPGNLAVEGFSNAKDKKTGNIVPGPAETSGQIHLGHEIVAINNKSIEGLTRDEAYSLLTRTMSRPITLRFRCMKAPLQKKDTGTRSKRENSTSKRAFKLGSFSVMFHEGPVGLLVKPLSDTNQLPAITGFGKNSDGSMRPAELCGKLSVGNLLIAVNGQKLQGKTFNEAVAIFKDGCTKFPLNCTFVEGCDVSIPFESVPPAINLAACNGHTIVTGFQPIPGPAELSKDISANDLIVKIGNVEVFKELWQYSKVIDLIKRSARPLTITFAKMPPMHTVASIKFENVESTFAVTFQDGALGLSLAANRSGAPTYVKCFVSLVGEAEKSQKVHPGQVLIKVDDQILTPGDINQTNHLLEKVRVPYSLTFRDMERYFWLISGPEH